MMHGFTDNYVKVQKPFDETSVNETEELVLGNIDRNGLVSVGIDADMMTVSEK